LCFLIIYILGQLSNCPSADIIIIKKPLWKYKNACWHQF
jgi:hypothetical protein